MPCGCGKKNTGGTVHFMGQSPSGSSDAPDPTEWGPIVWKYLHCLNEKIGFSGNPLTDADQAGLMETLINNLPQVIPCPECQSHAAAYLVLHPLPQLKGLTGGHLRIALRNWLWAFHNHVRATKGQPILLNQPEACSEHYAACFVPKCEYTLFVQNVAYAVRQGWVKIENWRKWYSSSEKVRIITGNIVI